MGTETPSNAENPENTEEPTLTPLEESILAIEREYPKYGGVKDDVIRSRLDISPFNYFQILNTLMDRPEVMERDPQTIGRLRRVREQKQRQNTHIARR